MLNNTEVELQINELLVRYPNLSVVEADSLKIRLNGYVDINRSAKGFVLNQSYKIIVNVFLDGRTLPIVCDDGGAIADNYHHKYTDGSLCLATSTDIRLRFIDGFNLAQWMDEYVEVYFFSYEYYQRFGTFPFGERSHGIEGVLETYSEIFDEQDAANLASLMMYVYNGNSYRGHVLCPCNSNKRLRQCHGKTLYPFLTDPKRRAIVSADVIEIARTLEEKKRNDNSRKNSPKTKRT